MLHTFIIHTFHSFHLKYKKERKKIVRNNTINENIVFQYQDFVYNLRM